VREATERILRSAGLGGTGAYSDSQGVPIARDLLEANTVSSGDAQTKHPGRSSLLQW
jgi:hypothetical protein